MSVTQEVAEPSAVQEASTQACPVPQTRVMVVVAGVVASDQDRSLMFGVASVMSPGAAAPPGSGIERTFAGDTRTIRPVRSLSSRSASDARMVDQVNADSAMPE